MRKRILTLCVTAIAAILTTVASASAQTPNPRIGVWRMQSDAPAPFSNVMTYAPYGNGGMSVTVEAVNGKGEKTKWGYVTLFDGQFRPVDGQQNSETSVEVIDERSTRISNKRNGKVYQVVINTLSADRNTISNEYVRLDENGKVTGVTHATYTRVK